MLGLPGMGSVGASAATGSAGSALCESECHAWPPFSQVTRVEPEGAAATHLIIVIVSHFRVRGQ